MNKNKTSPNSQNYFPSNTPQIGPILIEATPLDRKLQSHEAPFSDISTSAVLPHLFWTFLNSDVVP